jgi:catalase
MDICAGEKNLLDDEAAQIGGRNHSHATADLFEAIAKGDYPEWQLCIQTMNIADEHRFDFDPLDVTKTWPEDLFPLQPVGRMVRAESFTKHQNIWMDSRLFSRVLSMMLQQVS